MDAADIVVVGAGAAGLACARTLSGLGASVVVLEARDRVGGRIETARILGDGVVELGAQVLHGDRALSWGPADADGLRLVPYRPTGEFVFGLDGGGRAVAELLAEGGIPPWEVEARLDGTEGADRSFAEIVESSAVVAGWHRAVATEWVGQNWCADPRDLSWAGMSRTRRAWRSGPGELVAVDGLDALPRRLADGLDVRLRTPVRAIRWRPGAVELESADGLWRSSVVVVTVPVGVLAAGAVAFDPPLPSGHLDAARSIGVGDAVVMVAGLDEPAPATGGGLVVGDLGSFWRVVEGSRLLVGWARGPSAGRIRALGPRRGLVADVCRPLFDWLRPGLVQDEVMVTDWGADPWARGGYSYPRVGALDAPAALAVPVERTIFFGGEATAADGERGLVQGALASGVRAAREVAEVLGR